ncbi:hypothetical protein HCJ93_26095 [Streptomyces sp. SBST2-5]|uniref:Integral membrane protein n=1 Tax=Streptomyces composti TaxID=2720025 RepID=A0ABX1AAN5_9ACTN|nr:hypothetical protein [Streptomyces composti]NJP53440.1 hypothetical protein [Streptomyces composti]
MSAGLQLRRRTARGATALRGGGSWRPTPYQAAGFLCWLVMSLAFLRVPLCCDAGLQAAAVERLRADLLHPRHPSADLPGAGSLAYSPLALVQGAGARLSGLGGWELVRLTGPLNLLVLLTGVGRLMRVLTPRPWAPVAALAALTLLWGAGRGTAGPGPAQLVADLSHLAVCAAGLTLRAWALTGERARDDAAVRYVGPSGLRGLPGYAALGVLYGLIALVHPVTGAAAALGAVAFVAGWQRGRSGAVVGRWLLAGATGALVAVSWPYFDLLLAAFSGGPYEPVRAELEGVIWPALLLWLPGLPALWLRVRRGSWRDPLVLLFGSACALAAYGWVSGANVPAGVIGPLLVALPCALAVELAAARPWPVWRRVLGGAAAAGACAGFLTVQGGAVVPRALDPAGLDRPPGRPDYAWAARHIGPGDVVLTDAGHAGRTIAGYGADLAAPVVPDAALDERERQRRLSEVRGYLSPGSTRAERTAVARRYRVRWLLLTPRQQVPEEAVVVAWSDRTGEVLARLG